MGLYLEKIEENEKRIKKLKATIETSKAKLKKLLDENAHLSYLEIKAEYNCEGRELLEVLAREREQSAKLKKNGLTDSGIDATAKSVDEKDGDTDNSDDKFGQQMSFTDKQILTRINIYPTTRRELCMGRQRCRYARLYQKQKEGLIEKAPPSL